MKTFICAIVKDERKFIKEWVDYHLSIGIDKVYIFEDYGSCSHKDIFSNYNNVFIKTLEEYLVTNEHNSATLFALYDKFLKLCKEEHLCDWCLFIDIDEFLMFEEDYNLLRLEEEYKDIPAVWLSWKMYGANGHIKSPKGGVLKNYTKEGGRIEPINLWNYKSLVNVEKNRGWYTLHAARGGRHTNGDGRPNGPQCYNKAWLNHYYSKSFEDYCDRMFNRGNMSNNYRSFDLFFDNNPEFQNIETKLLDSVRFDYRLCSTMWISRRRRLFDGGNVNFLLKLKKSREGK